MEIRGESASVVGGASGMARATAQVRSSGCRGASWRAVAESI
jgi:hypothetical protein